MNVQGAFLHTYRFILSYLLEIQTSPEDNKVGIAYIRKLMRGHHERFVHRRSNFFSKIRRIFV